MSQSAENVVNLTAGILVCRIFDGKCRKKFRSRYMSQHRREMSQLILTTKLIEKCIHSKALIKPIESLKRSGVDKCVKLMNRF